jgi:hypothetical protein
VVGDVMTRLVKPRGRSRTCDQPFLENLRRHAVDEAEPMRRHAQGRHAGGTVNTGERSVREPFPAWHLLCAAPEIRPSDPVETTHDLWRGNLYAADSKIARVPGTAIAPICEKEGWRKWRRSENDA